MSVILSVKGDTIFVDWYVTVSDHIKYITTYSFNQDQ